MEDTQKLGTPNLAYTGMDVSLYQFDGPLDLLLELARRQKVDLLEISIVELADQYLAFIEEMRNMRISVAADYLLMASVLAYLKSRLLLPKEEREGLEESPELQAERLAWRLQYLSKIRDVSKLLWERSQFGRDIFGVGMFEVIAVERQSEYSDTLFDLLSAYGTFSMRSPEKELKIIATDLYSAEQLLLPLQERVRSCADWVEIGDLLPSYDGDSLKMRSAVSATLLAGLELAKRGDAEFRQSDNFAPIYVRRAEKV